MAIIGTLLPLNRSKYWFVRDQVYFRAYYLIANCLMACAYLFLDIPLILVAVAIILHLACIFICLRSIWPYFYIHKVSVPGDSKDQQSVPLKLLVFNVLHTNEDYQAFLDLVQRDSPDAILLLEPGQAWDTGIADLYHDYVHSVKDIKENTYGIIFMSRIPFIESKVNYLVSESTPSIEVLMSIAGRQIRVYGLHPEPPIPGEQSTSKPKDLEIMLTAKKIKSQPDRELDILIGDLNDVGWSKVSNKFKKITGLKDPRVGRGFYATFPTYFPLRIPIDHIFCSSGFLLKDITRHANIGSDHFPVSATFLIPQE